jgi:hypothetical protein
MRFSISAATIAFLSCADVISGYVPIYRDTLARQQQRRQSATKPLQGYAFLYFTGNTVAAENIYLPASKGNVALHWSELNSGKPILKSSFGTKGLRDPFILRSQDGKKSIS